MSTTYIYPSDPEGGDIAIAFDEQELESLVNILEKEGGPIAEKVSQTFKIDQNDWACFSFQGRFICDKCGLEHIGVMMAKQILEFLTMLLREKYPECQSIIKKLEEKPISDSKMSDKYTGNHRYTQKEDEYIIPNNSYLSSGILFPFITYLQWRIEQEKGGKQYHFDILTGEQILEEKHGKQYQEYLNQLTISKQILEKCKKGDKRISLTNDERLWLRRLLEDKRSSNGMWAPVGQYDEIRDESRYHMYHIHKCLRALYPDEDLLDDVENKINEVIDRIHYSNLDFNKIPSTFVKSLFKVGEHISKGSWCENCVHDAVNHEMNRNNFIDSDLLK